MSESNTFYPSSLREEELKNRVAQDLFGAFDCARIIGNIDFCVDIPATELSLGYEAEPMLWAEAKAGNKKDIVASFVQLILTIGGEHTADKNHFMSDRINGRGLSNLNPENPVNPVENLSAHSAPLGTRFARRVRFPMGREPPQGAVTRLCVKENMSPAATSVLDAGRELWRYYHSQPDANPDASYYDIRMHFQGATVDAKGKSKMNSDSKDAKYTELIGNLRAAMKRLAKEIEPKVYEYGFLRR